MARLYLPSACCLVYALRWRMQRANLGHASGADKRPEVAIPPHPCALWCPATPRTLYFGQCKKTRTTEKLVIRIPWGSSQ